MIRHKIDYCKMSPAYTSTYISFESYPVVDDINENKALFISYENNNSTALFHLKLNIPIKLKFKLYKCIYKVRNGGGGGGKEIATELERF